MAQADIAPEYRERDVIQFPRQSQFKRINAFSDFFAFTTAHLKEWVYGVQKGLIISGLNQRRLIYV